MDKAVACCSFHLIEGDGTFNVAKLERFMKEVKLAECGLSYAIVSIMGPQSGGKSTLLNHLFHTRFTEMDEVEGRSQTTKGIWMARCVGIDPCTIVMDLEGTDGREREDDKAFEKQSALFALAVSDVVLINMWCHDIGRDHGANTPLLKTVFQVMLQLFSPRKITLMFVIRDKTRTSLEKLERTLREDIQKIWDWIHKPQAYEKTPLSDFFNVLVVALSSYHEKEEQFTEQVAGLRQRFFHSIAPGGLAGDRRGVVPASGFSFSAQEIWKVIKENKDLDMPTHRVMVATIRCEEIANEKYASFTADEEWNAIEEAVQSHPVADFGKRLSSIIDACLSDYDAEATYFVDEVRFAKRKQLEEKLLQLIQPAYQSMLGYIVTGTLVKFKDAFDHALKGGQGFAVAARDCTKFSMKQFDEQCADVIIKQASWDTGRIRDKLHHDLESYVVAVRTAKLSELPMQYELKLLESLSGPVEAILYGASNDTWPALRGLLQRETETAVAECSSALAGIEIDRETMDIILLRLKDFARGVVEDKAKEEATRVVSRMKDRFTTIYSHDSDLMPRVWTENVDIRAIAKTARSSCLELLSVLAAIRLDGVADNIRDTLFLALDSASLGQLPSSTWEQVPASKTLITPVQCKSLWSQFLSETEYAVTQAIAAQAIDANSKAVAAQARAAAAQAEDAKAQAVSAEARAAAAEAQAEATATAQAQAAQEARDHRFTVDGWLENIGGAIVTLATLGAVNPSRR